MKFFCKRFFALLLMCALCALSAAGCGKSAASLQPSPRQITGSVVQELKMKNMTELTGTQIALRYSLDVSVLENKSVYISSQNSNADEVAVFQLKTGEKVAPVMSAVNERIQDKLDSFESLNPAECEKVKNAFAENIGSYVIVVICDNAEHAKEVIDEIMQ